MAETKIEWADKVWNPVTGCSRVSEGCRNCYAERMARRLVAMDVHAYDGTVNARGWTGQVNEVPEALGKPSHWKNPQRVFVNSMSDLFHPSVRVEYIANVWAVMGIEDRHTYMVLTKRADRMMEVLNSQEFQDEYRDCVRILTENTFTGLDLPLDNVGLGVSVENQKAGKERLPLLAKTPAGWRFVSVEPMLERIDLVDCFEPTQWDWDELNAGDNHAEPEEFVEECEAECDWINYGHDLVVNPEYMEYQSWRQRRARQIAMGNALDWVICGAESGPGRRPFEMDWARQLKGQCEAANVPFFFKQGVIDRRVVKMPKLDGQVCDETPWERLAAR